MIYSPNQATKMCLMPSSLQIPFWSKSSNSLVSVLRNTTSLLMRPRDDFSLRLSYPYWSCMVVRSNSPILTLDVDIYPKTLMVWYTISSVFGSSSNLMTNFWIIDQLVASINKKIRSMSMHQLSRRNKLGQDTGQRGI